MTRKNKISILAVAGLLALLSVIGYAQMQTNCVAGVCTTTAPGLISLIDCATTAACPSTVQGGIKTVVGRGTLVTGSPSTYAVTALSPAFTSATTYTCYAEDSTTVANNIAVLTAGYVSGSAVTFTGPNTNTDTFRFYCTGY